MPLTWRTIAGFFVYLLANVLSVAMGYGGGLLVILVNGAALVLLCRWTTSFAACAGAAGPSPPGT